MSVMVLKFLLSMFGWFRMQIYHQWQERVGQGWCFHIESIKKPGFCKQSSWRFTSPLPPVPPGRDPQRRSRLRGDLGAAKFRRWQLCGGGDSWLPCPGAYLGGGTLPKYFRALGGGDWQWVEKRGKEGHSFFLEDIFWMCILDMVSENDDYSQVDLESRRLLLTMLDEWKRHLAGESLLWLHHVAWQVWRCSWRNHHLWIYDSFHFTPQICLSKLPADLAELGCVFLVSLTCRGRRAMAIWVTSVRTDLSWDSKATAAIPWLILIQATMEKPDHTPDVFGPPRSDWGVIFIW